MGFLDELETCINSFLIMSLPLLNEINTGRSSISLKSRQYEVHRKVPAEG
jgi:hypothetical protein